MRDLTDRFSYDCLWRAEARSKKGKSACGVWRGVRGPKNAPVDGRHELFGFLTTEPNAVVAPIHAKAMPVILTTQAEIDLWLLADAPKALELQRPLPDDALQVVASGEKEDGPREDAMPDWDQDPMLPL